jgi:integrating conjugative element protein (TIGR03746 family)
MSPGSALGQHAQVVGYPPENVYAFALYIFGQLNRWPSDGEQDYRRAIYGLQSYLTPACKAFLDGDYEYRKAAGELRQRVRGVYEILGRGYSEDPELRVKQLDRDSWLVKLDLNADEYYAAEPVKRVVVRYPLRVVRFDLDPERNKWGLALDCYQGTPQKSPCLEVSHEADFYPGTHRRTDYGELQRRPSS